MTFEAICEIVRQIVYYMVVLSGTITLAGLLLFPIWKFENSAPKRKRKAKY